MGYTECLISLQTKIIVTTRVCSRRDESTSHRRHEDEEEATDGTGNYGC